MRVFTFFFNPIRVCTYVLSARETDSDAIIIDAGCYTDDERERLSSYIESHRLRLKAQLLTHAHLDHIFGVRYVEQQWGLVPYLHPADEDLLRNLGTQADFFGIPFSDLSPHDYIPIADNEQLDFGFVKFKVIATPGHTRGGVCLLATDTGYAGLQSAGESHAGEGTYTDSEAVSFGVGCYQLSRCLFSGDTLFQNGYGRTDLYGGDYATLMQSLDRLFTLDSDLVVLPGHGLPTTIGHEKLGLRNQ